MGVRILQPMRINKDVLCLNLIRLVGIMDVDGRMCLFASLIVLS